MVNTCNFRLFFENKTDQKMKHSKINSSTTFISAQTFPPSNRSDLSPLGHHLHQPRFQSTSMAAALATAADHPLRPLSTMDSGLYSTSSEEDDEKQKQQLKQQQQQQHSTGAQQGRACGTKSIV